MEETEEEPGRRSQDIQYKNFMRGVNNASVRLQLRFCVSDTVLRRFSNTMRFFWVLLLALLDSLTAWLNSLCQEHIDISTVLRIEHCMLTQQAKQVHTQDYSSLQQAQAWNYNKD